MTDVSLSLDDLLAAPIGVGVLDRIEHSQREEFSPFEALENTVPAAVEWGTREVGTMSLGGLLKEALKAAHRIAGPWTSGAATSLAYAYELAASRRPIAEAICERFGAELDAPFDPDHQQCWLSALKEGYQPVERFTDFSQVYGNGEFTWSGLWTVSAPPPEVHDELIRAWEMYPGPITRWRLPLHPDVRLWTVDRPFDWVRLVETYPKVVTKSHGGWELPGPNQHNEDVDRLMEVESQHAARKRISRHVLPDWTAVAQDFDGVHLSWAGFLTTEGFVSDLPSGGVTMLRYWGSERTLWFRDVFGAPEPLSAPELSGTVGGEIGVDASGVDDVRTRQDLTVMSQWLGR